LPESVAEYLRENFENFMPEKSVNEAVFVPNPRPENLVPSRRWTRGPFGQGSPSGS